MGKRFNCCGVATCLRADATLEMSTCCCAISCDRPACRRPSLLQLASLLCREGALEWEPQAAGSGGGAAADAKLRLGPEGVDGLLHWQAAAKVGRAHACTWHVYLCLGDTREYVSRFVQRWSTCRGVCSTVPPLQCAGLGRPTTGTRLTPVQRLPLPPACICQEQQQEQQQGEGQLDSEATLPAVPRFPGTHCSVGWCPECRGVLPPDASTEDKVAALAALACGSAGSTALVQGAPGSQAPPAVQDAQEPVERLFNDEPLLAGTEIEVGWGRSLAGLCNKSAIQSHIAHLASSTLTLAQ